MIERMRSGSSTMPTPDCAPAAALPAPPGWEQRGYKTLRRGRDRLLSPLVTLLAWIGVPPALVSLGGVLFALSCCLTLSTRPRWALLGFAAALVSDAVDGALARRLGTDSALGKLLDQLADLATFSALLTAVALAGLISPAAAIFGVVATALVLALGVAYHREPLSNDARRRPRAGFFAHAHKALVYSALALYLLSGVNLLAAAVAVANGLATLCALGFVVGLLGFPGRRRMRLERVPERLNLREPDGL